MTVTERGRRAENFTTRSTGPTLPPRWYRASAQKKVKPATGHVRAGLDAVQLRFATGLTSEEYVKRNGWQFATLERCPLHPKGGCGFARHTPYARVEPPGAFVARYYCPTAHVTFSLLPDCLAARLSSTLAEVEQAAATMASGAGTQAELASKLRPEIGVQGALRWARRRVVAVSVALVALKGLLPDVFAERQPTLEDFRDALGVAQVLPRARELAGKQVSSVPCPVGLGHRCAAPAKHRRQVQHETGADPPRGPV